jgi:hypothetical protein
MMRWEQSWAIEVLEAFAPSAPDTPQSDARLAPREGEVDYLHAYRRMHAGSTPLAALGLRFALWMVALAPIWLLGRFITFSELARAERTELLSRLLRHTSLVVRELALLLKLTAAIALLGTPSVRERSGYDKPQAAAAAVARGDTARRALPLLASAPPRAVPLNAPVTALPIHAAHDASASGPSERVAS